MGLARGSAPMLTCCLCACSKALMKLNEAEVLRSALEKKGSAIDRFDEAIFFSLKGEVKRQGEAKGVGRDAARCLPCWQGIFLP